MPTAPLPPDESGRLAALEEASILDTMPEKAFDDIVAIASLVCGAPMAVIGLIDRDRQWYKAKVGVDSDQVARDLSFCVHTILQDDVLEVNDARKDPRFRDNPFVVTDPGIRFYAGAPLRTPEGHALGTLCVYANEPQLLTPAQRDALDALAVMASERIQMRRLLTRGTRTDDADEAEDGPLPAADSFTNAVAHELATPLTSAMLQVRGLRMLIESGSAEQRRRSLDILERNVHRLGDAAARIIAHSTRAEAKARAGERG